jgi:hypothetical protein
VAEEAISGWVSAGDVVIMKDRDLSILAEPRPSRPALRRMRVSGRRFRTRLRFPMPNSSSRAS